MLQAFQDKPKDYDAWNIDADFEKVHWDILEAQEVRPIIDGPLCPGFVVTKKFQNSAITQNIRLCEGMQRVDIVNDMDWHEKHILLKAGFTLAAQSNHATYEIPFGSIDRPTTRNTKEEQAMYEVPAIRWADISDSSHGFSLLNDSKYGYDAKDNVLRISLLRSPESPDPHADEGRHHFTYSLYPHRWRLETSAYGSTGIRAKLSFDRQSSSQFTQHAAHNPFTGCQRIHRDRANH